MRVRLVAQVMVLVSLTAAAGGAAAQSARAVDVAKAHFKAGEALYEAGEYADAIREWSEGYDMAPRPAFLVNLGQAYRKMKDWPKAAEYFQHYLTVTPADDSRRAEVRDLLAEMQRKMAPPPPPPPATPTAPELAAPPATTTTATTTTATTPMTTTTAAATSPLTTPAPPPERSFLRRNWWIVPAGAVVVGVALGVGIYYGTRPSSGFDCAGTISCIDASSAARAP